MAEARYRAEGLEVAWPLLTELAWLSTRRFADLLTRLTDASLDALHRRFDAQFDGAGGLADLAWQASGAGIRRHASIRSTASRADAQSPARSHSAAA
jgi:hypothetical protein